MDGKEPLVGLFLDKVVFDHMTNLQGQGNRRARMNMAEAEKVIGLNNGQIVRAVNEIRSKGYVVISATTRRTVENDFRLAETKEEYSEWRDRLLEDMAVLQGVLDANDRAAAVRFGPLEKQPGLFG